jgi:hypothetical protein
MIIRWGRAIRWKRGMEAQKKGRRQCPVCTLLFGIWMKEEKEKDDFLGKEYIGFPFT